MKQDSSFTLWSVAFLGSAGIGKSIMLMALNHELHAFITALVTYLFILSFRYPDEIDQFFYSLPKRLRAIDLWLKTRFIRSNR